MKYQAAKVIPGRLYLLVGLLGVWAAGSRADTIQLESASVRFEADRETAQWMLLDKRSGVRWPSEGMASPGDASWLHAGFIRPERGRGSSARFAGLSGGAVVFSLVEDGQTLELRYEKPGDDTVRVLGDALAIADADGGYAIIPSREGLLVPVKNDTVFKRVFGTSEYEGCHLNMLGFMKKGSALLATWDDAYGFAVDHNQEFIQGNVATSTFEALKG